MESQLSPSGIFSQDTQDWNCSTRFRQKWHKAESNLKIFEFGSSSCRCTITSTSRKVKTTSRNVFRNLRKSRLAQTDSRRDTGLSSDQVQKKNGVEHTRTSPKESGTDQQKLWWLLSKKADTSYFEQQVRWIEDSSKARKVENYRFTTTVIQRPQSCYFAQSFPSTSWVSAEQSRIGVENWLSKSLIMHFPAQGNL